MTSRIHHDQAGRTQRALSAYCFLLTLLCASSAWSTSIQQLDFNQLVGRAEMVFEGRVISSISRWNTAETEIVTEVRFEVLDVIKGDFNQSTLLLEFLGGRVGEQSMAIEAMVYPQAGEQGVYFVESLSRKQVNPLLGWSQGHFLVENDEVLTNDKQPVVAIDETERALTGHLSEGRASGVVAKKKSGSGAAQQTASGALSVLNFKNTIKQLGEASEE